MLEEDTIFAPATPPGEAGVAVIRISGPKAKQVLTSVFRKQDDVYVPRMMYFGEVYDSDTLIDEALGVYFSAPNSYTGEDVAEIQCHGGRMTVKCILELLRKQGIRLAEPGEFSKRAFLNGKIDISQAEGVQALIGALSETGAKVAARQMNGALKEKIFSIQDALKDVIAALEAGIEYPEENLEESIKQAQLPNIKSVLDLLETLLGTYQTGKLLKDGIHIAIAGRPNVGKSSLLNAILGEERAIVTQIPGTTRDVISEYFNLDSLPIKFTDTAGLRDTGDFVEKIGVERSRAEIKAADLVLFLIDASLPLSKEDEEIFEGIKKENKPFITVLNKTDLFEQTTKELLQERFQEEVVEISAKTKDGIHLLLEKIKDQGESYENPEGVIIANERHFSALLKAKDSLSDAYQFLLEQEDLDCAAIDLYAAYQALGEITGSTLTEDIIDRIFEKFCLGK